MRACQHTAHHDS